MAHGYYVGRLPEERTSMSMNKQDEKNLPQVMPNLEKVATISTSKRSGGRRISLC